MILARAHAAPRFHCSHWQRSGFVAAPGAGAAAQAGASDGRNVRIEIRRANSDPELMRSYGTEPAGPSPDVFLVHSNPASRLRPWNGRRPLAKTIPGQISGINRREQQGGEGHD